MALHAYPTVVHMLRDTAARWPEREALICGDERLSYKAYLAAVATFAHELVKLGARGERVALVLGNGLDVCIGTFAAHAAGAQVVPLNPL
jgi:long-chain acyl-CoA synthetase